MVTNRRVGVPSLAGFFCLLATVACSRSNAQRESPVKLVEAAIQAEGGIDAVRALKRLAISAQVQHWEPGQSLEPGGEARPMDDGVMTLSWDLEKGVARTDWDRQIQYPLPTNPTYTEVVTPTTGAVTREGRVTPMSGIRLATHIRELERASPALLAKALDTPGNLAALPDVPFRGRSYPAATFSDGPTKFTVLFNRESHLPEVIRTLDDDIALGDNNYDLVLADWKPLNGVEIPRSLVYLLDGVQICKVTYTSVASANTFSQNSFEIPEAVRGRTKPPATDKVPYQWVMRMLVIDRFVDSDAVNYDAAVNPSGLKLVDLAPNVHQVVGGSHNNLIVAMKDYLIVFEAPINEWQSHWTMEAAKAKYPDKPIKYLVLTHHHMDHHAGSRTYVARGVTVIVPSQAKAFFEHEFVAPHTVNPDELQLHPRKADILPVTDQLTLEDGNDEVRLYNIENPHVDGMLIGYEVGARLAWVTDLFSPVRDKVKTSGMVAFNEALKKYGLKPDHLAGGHGASGPMAELLNILSTR